MQDPLSNSKSVKITKNVIDFQFRKKKYFNFHISQWNKKLLIDPVFSNKIILLIKKVPILNLSRSSNSFKGIYFFLRNSKAEFFKESQYFFVCLQSLTFF